jgi:hypothetical protein
MHSPARDPYYHLINGCQLAADRQSRRVTPIPKASAEAPFSDALDPDLRLWVVPQTDLVQLRVIPSAVWF